MKRGWPFGLVISAALVLASVISAFTGVLLPERSYQLLFVAPVLLALSTLIGGLSNRGPLVPETRTIADQLSDNRWKYYVWVVIGAWLCVLDGFYLYVMSSSGAHHYMVFGCAIFLGTLAGGFVLYGSFQLCRLSWLSKLVLEYRCERHQLNIGKSYRAAYLTAFATALVLVLLHYSKLAFYSAPALALICIGVGSYAQITTIAWLEYMDHKNSLEC